MPAQQPASVISHVSLGTSDYPRAKAFYDAVLGTLGIRCLMEHGTHGLSAGYGDGFPDFWIGPPHDGGRAAPGNGTHVCFLAPSAEAVNAFHATALRMGGRDDGAPGLRPQYTPNYYAAFVHDPDGHKIEAVFFVPQGEQP